MPIDSSGEHTLDFTFASSGGPVEVVVAFLAGVEFMAFTGMSFMAAKPVVNPGDFAPGG